MVMFFGLYRGLLDHFVHGLIILGDNSAGLSIGESGAITVAKVGEFVHI